MLINKVKEENNIVFMLLIGNASKIQRGFSKMKKNFPVITKYLFWSWILIFDIYFKLRVQAYYHLCCYDCQNEAFFVQLQKLGLLQNSFDKTN